MRRFVPCMFAIAFAASFGAVAQPAAPPAPAEAETLAADTPRATPAGVKFTAPANWKLSNGANFSELTAPEGDSRIVIVDAKGKDAAEAVAFAWTAYRAEMKRPLKLSTPQPPLEGWEERRAFTYETSPNERLEVQALAARAGTSWTVTLLEATDPVIEKRGSQFGLAIRSVRPAGYQRETFAGRKAHPLDAQRIATLKAFLEKGMKDLGVPGVGLAFLDGGKVVWEGGLGVKELGKPAKVDADTLFMAASNTKAMTTLLLARLVDEKKLRWDEPVVEAYPPFRLGDAATTKSVLVKHLVCACTGMPRQDMEWLFQFDKATPATALAMLGTMQPTSKFGELFQYSNLMAAAAGYVGAAIDQPGKELGAAYDEAMRRKVFVPLGMTRTTFDMRKALAGNHASPHGKDADGVLRKESLDLDYTIVAARPAGGVWTSAHDLARYVQMELARGKLPDGSTLVSEDNLMARRAPQVAVGEDVTYGMGLFVRTEWGIPVVHHGGDLLGYHSDMMWFPDHGLGAVILTNSDPGVSLRGPLMRRMAELVFDGKPEAQARLDASVSQREAGRKQARERLAIPPEAAAVKALAGRYTSAELGDVVVKRQGRRVVFDVGEWRSAVASRRNDDGTLSFVTIDPGMDGFEFVVADRTLVLRDAQHEYTFKPAEK